MEEMDLSALVILMKPLDPCTPTRSQQLSCKCSSWGGAGNGSAIKKNEVMFAEITLCDCKISDDVMMEVVFISKELSMWLTGVLRLSMSHMG